MGRLDFAFCGEPLTVDDAARALAPGKFVAVPDGMVHYELTGPPGGQPVALIHGFSTPYFTWDRTAPALAAAGLRVLRYDLFGRGWSDRPDVRYEMALYVRQLGGLLDALGLTRPVDLVGLSMGGAIAVAFAARHPERVRRLVMVDPAGLPADQPVLARLVRLPVVGEIVFGVLGGWFLLSQQGKDFYRLPADLADFQRRYRVQMAYRGFRRALLSTVRGDAISDRSADFAAVGRQGRRVLLIMGRQDRTVPFATHERILELMPGAEFQAIEEAGHMPHYERPELVNPLLAGFLTRAPAAE